MARPAQTVFLEEWLRNSSDNYRNQEYPSPSSARAIIQAWTELRDSLQHQSFQSHHIKSLETLLNSKNSLYVADPQAKLVISILSSHNISLPREPYSLFLELLYVWARKSSKPSSALVGSALEVLSDLFSYKFETLKSFLLISKGVLLLGAFTCVPTLSLSSKRVCLDLLCGLLEEKYQLIGCSEGLIREVLAGIGYALSSSEDADFVRILASLLGIWGREGGPRACVSHGLLILHLVEWVFSGFIRTHSSGKVEVFTIRISGASKKNYVPFALVMVAAGVLRATNRLSFGGLGMETISRLRIAAEEIMEDVASDSISRTGGFTNLSNDPANTLLLQCFSIALARCGPVSCMPNLFLCLASALVAVTFPLKRYYKMILEYELGDSSQREVSDVKEHLGSAIFKEAGAATRAFCNQYVLVDEDNKNMVESFIWTFCKDIYFWHRKVVFMLRGERNEILGDLEKVAESAFLMVVVFALAVTKHRLTANFSQEVQMEISVQILLSFSYVEYFRRMRLTEYMDTIRAVVVSVQENECACVSFVKSMPSYGDLTSQQGFSSLLKREYVWCDDDVQTARILFYLRVMPTCIERVPVPLFREVMAATMFLYMGHLNGKVARASHSLFVAFISSGKDSNQEDRVLLKEQLVFYYVQRSLEEFPAITPFDGMASGVAAVVHHLPAGSPAIYYCIHSLVEKTTEFCREVSSCEGDIWKNWQGESEHSKKLVEFLLRLTALVDIQVLPNLMKSLAQLILKLPKDGQHLILDELHSLVAESDDVTRKPLLVSWLQSLSYLSSQGSSSASTKNTEVGEKSIRALSRNPFSWNGLSARL